MKHFQKKSFVVFLILAAVIMPLSFAKAGSIIDPVAGNVINAVVDVINVVVNAVIAFVEIIVGTPLAVVGSDDMVNDADCRLENLNESIWTAGDQCEKQQGVYYISPVDLGCTYQIPVTFYDSVQACAKSGQCIQYNYNGDCIQWEAVGNPSSSGRKVAIYRFIMPVGGDLTDWFTKQIRNKINGGVTGMDSYWDANSDEKFTEVDYNSMCPGGVCRFTDTSVPENSYIAYSMKILGSGYGNYYLGSGEEVRCEVNKNNKFTAPNNTNYVTFDYGSGGNPAYGFVGPYKTGVCPRPSVDLKINGSDGQLNLYLPNSGAVLNWEAQNVSTCSVSGDWNGDKPISGSENLGNLSRGTANPGGGKTYQFSIACDSSYGLGSVTDSVSATVFEYPVCSFSADPSTITLPNSSQLSQSCSYADSCSIDQKVGTVCSGETDCATDSSNVRPTATTTFTLTCQGLDGSQLWQTTVGIGESGDIKYEEVNP